jgi:hypothetical protein
MNFVIITFFLAFSGILFLLIKLKRQEIRTKKIERETIKLHNDLNYPSLKDEDQFKILEEYDLTSIKNLSPKFKELLVPNCVIKNYISVSKDDFRNHLISSDFVNKKSNKYKTHPKEDGFWWDGEKIIDQERGIRYQYWNAKSKEEALDVYIKILWGKIKTE